MSVKTIKVSFNRQQKNLAIPAGISYVDLSRLLASSFGIQGSDIAGFESEVGTIVPLSYACRCPSDALSGSVFKLLLSPTESNKSASNHQSKSPVRVAQNQHDDDDSDDSVDSSSFIVTHMEPHHPIQPSSQPVVSVAKVEHHHHQEEEEQEEEEEEEDLFSLTEINKIAKFLHVMRHKSVLTKEEVDIIEEHIFNNSLVLRAAFEVAASSSNPKYFASLCKDIAAQSLSTRGLDILAVEEDLITAADVLLERGDVTTSQLLCLHDLILVRDAAVGAIYDKFSTSSDLASMLTSLKLLAQRDDDDEEEEEDADKKLGQATFVKQLIALLVKSGALSSEEGSAVMSSLDHEVLSAALGLFNHDWDLVEFADTISRLGRSLVNKKVRQSVAVVEAKPAAVPVPQPEKPTTRFNPSDLDKDEKSRLILLGNIKKILIDLKINPSLLDRYIPAIPVSFLLIVWSGVNSKVMTIDDGLLLCDLFLNQHDGVIGSFEVYKIEPDERDLVDTLVRICRLSRKPKPVVVKKNVVIDDDVYERKAASSSSSSQLSASIAAVKGSTDDDDDDVVEEEEEVDEAECDYDADEDDVDDDDDSRRRKAVMGVEHATLQLLSHALEFMIRNKLIDVDTAKLVLRAGVQKNDNITQVIDDFVKNSNAVDFITHLSLIGRNLSTSGTNKHDDVVEEEEEEEEEVPVVEELQKDASLEPDEQLQEFISLLFNQGQINEEDCTSLRLLVAANDDMVMAAFDVYLRFQDVNDLVDSLMRIAKRHKQVQAMVEHQHHYSVSADDDGIEMMATISAKEIDDGLEMTKMTTRDEGIAGIGDDEDGDGKNEIRFDDDQIANPDSLLISKKLVEIIGTMNLSLTEVKVLRNAIADDDKVIIGALEVFRLTQDDEELKDTLLRVARYYSKKVEAK